MARQPNGRAMNAEEIDEHKLPTDQVLHELQRSLMIINDVTCIDPLKNLCAVKDGATLNPHISAFYKNLAHHARLWYTTFALQNPTVDQMMGFAIRNFYGPLAENLQTSANVVFNSYRGLSIPYEEHQEEAWAQRVLNHAYTQHNYVFSIKRSEDRSKTNEIVKSVQVTHVLQDMDAQLQTFYDNVADRVKEAPSFHATPIMEDRKQDYLNWKNHETGSQVSGCFFPRCRLKCDGAAPLWYVAREPTGSQTSFDVVGAPADCFDVFMTTIVTRDVWDALRTNEYKKMAVIDSANTPEGKIVVVLSAFMCYLSQILSQVPALPCRLIEEPLLGPLTFNHASVAKTLPTIHATPDTSTAEQRADYYDRERVLEKEFAELMQKEGVDPEEAFKKAAQNVRKSMQKMVKSKGKKKSASLAEVTEEEGTPLPEDEEAIRQRTLSTSVVD